MLNELGFCPNLCQNFIDNHKVFALKEEGTKAIGIIKVKDIKDEYNRINKAGTRK